MCFIFDHHKGSAQNKTQEDFEPARIMPIQSLLTMKSRRAFTFMTDTAAESLRDLVATSLERVNELWRAGDPAVLLAAANAAADEIEQRVGEPLNDAEREALTAVRRFTLNAAADCWPGWSVPDKPPERQTLLVAQQLAQRSVRLVKKLNLGSLQEGTGIWLCGAFDLALGKHVEASSAFGVARQHFIAAKAPGLALLTEGYIAIVRQITDLQVPADAEDLQQITARIAAGAFEDGADWIEQLRTALKVFA
jgi:hypothetical protein